ncbi:hypothetical protein [Lysinibacillus sp. LK3]|uniref:hypothetical protein n=1 Tax=Lysinibacillus sp. LK3 TaxID=1628207 RepID=UPI00069FC157|nr:hypothetical protein [Lysinibacillus sp. LK3]
MNYELKIIVKRSDIEQNKSDQMVYLIQKWVLENLSTKDNWALINKIGKVLSLELTKQDKARLYEVLELNRENKHTDGLVVSSIDKVKGLEGERCLFILTTELSDYLFQINTNQNKMLNYLYVALTRSKKELVILISSEVEEKYGHTWIDDNFKELLK